MHLKNILDKTRSEKVTRKTREQLLEGRLYIKIANVHIDPDQPRTTHADDDDLALLAESVLSHGVMSSLIVQSIPGRLGHFKIIDGERRWRAAQIALASGRPCLRKDYDLSRISITVMDVANDADKLMKQITSNVTSKPMNDEDTAKALHAYISMENLSQAELARQVGRSETWVKNVLSRVKPGRDAVAEIIGVPASSIHSNEMARMIAWYNDPEKSAILPLIRKHLSEGGRLTRSAVTQLEESFVIRHDFPALKDRHDLSLSDLRTWKHLWSSQDIEQKNVAIKVLNGMTLSEAMRIATPPIQVVPSMGRKGCAASDHPKADASAASGDVLTRPVTILDDLNANFSIEQEDMDLQVVSESVALSGYDPMIPADKRLNVQSVAASHGSARNTHEIILRFPPYDDRIRRLISASGVSVKEVSADVVFQAIDILLERVESYPEFSDF